MRSIKPQDFAKDIPDISSLILCRRFGYFYDGFTGVLRAGERWYAPHLMRWLSRDPILFEGGYNVYEYVGGRVTGFVDPDGTDSKDTYVKGLQNAIARGDSAEIETLLEAGGPRIAPAFRQKAQDEIIRLRSTIDRIIAQECKGRVNREVPGEFRGRIYEEVLREANAGVRKAQKVLKLLNDNRFKK